MGDLISRSALIKRVEEWNTKDDFDRAFYRFTMSRIIEQPTIDAVPVVRGKWIDDHGSDVCSICGFSCDDTYYLGEGNFCPNCGADMRGNKT